MPGGRSAALDDRVAPECPPGPAEETGGTFRLHVHDVLANHEHAVALCMLSASRENRSVEFPVANVSHIRDGKVTEFWIATTDPQAGSQWVAACAMRAVSMRTARAPRKRRRGPKAPSPGRMEHGWCITRPAASS